MRKEVFIDGIKYISQSEVDAIRKEAGLHYFREGYKYLRATDTKIVPYDELAEMTVVGAFENLIRKEANLNTNDTGKEERLKVETRDKEFIQICFGNAISGACFDYNVDHLKEILTRDMAILQPTNDNAFVWTDKLVAESFKYILSEYQKSTEWSGNDAAELYHINNFKQSKQSAPEPSALPNKEWEVLEIECYGGEVRKLSFGEYRLMDTGIGFDFDYLMKRPDSKIKSVLRLLDGAVFKLGDNVLHTNNVVKREGIIESFRVLNHGNAKSLFVRTNNYDVPFCYINPTPTQPVVDANDKGNYKPVLFTTEDRVEITDPLQPIYHVYPKDTFNDFSINAMHSVDSYPAYKKFSTREAAEQYIIDNKPCLSLNDCSKWYEAWYPQNPMKEAFLHGLKQLVKQKLNK